MVSALEIPGRRTIAARLVPGQAKDGLVGAHEVGLFGLAALVGGRDMCPAVMGDLMARLHHRLAFAGE